MQQDSTNTNHIANLDNGAISLFYYDHSTDKMIIFDKGETWGIGLNDGFLQLKEGRIHINPSYKDYNSHVGYQSLSACLKEDYNYPFYDRLIVAYDDDVKLGDVWRYLFGIFGKISGVRFVSKLHLAAFYNGANLMNGLTILHCQGDRECAIEAWNGIIEILGREELGEDRRLCKSISDEDFSKEIIAGALIWQHIWEHTTLGNDLVFLDSIPFEVKLGIFPDKQELVFPEYTTIPCKKVLEVEKGYAPQLYIKYADEIFMYNIDERFKNDAKLNVDVDIDTNNLPCLKISSQTHPYPITVTWDQLIYNFYDIDLREETERENIHEFTHNTTHYEETEMNDFKTKKKCINALPPKSILHGSSYTYEIVKALGQGTFGISYLANVRLSGALGELQSTVQVAIKEFFMKDVNSRQGSTVTSGSDSEIYRNYRKDFMREANNLARMKHPHIVKVLEAFEANNTCYFSMEYINGGNLNEYILQCQSLSERQALQGIVEIGEALSFMHDNKMLHLDLKPLNVMRHKDGRLVLIDFGLSKQFGGNGEPETSTRIGLGTPGYAPLEQANYKKGEGFPATLDIYALGATLFKMLTGMTPPNASTLFNEGFPEENFRQCGVSGEVIKLVAWAMEPMKRKRPQTVKAFLDEAKRLLLLTEMSKKEWDINGTGPLPVGFQLRSDSSVYEIVECLSKDACSYVYKAVRKGRENEDVILLENMPNEFMGGRVGGSSGRYEIDFSISDYDEWTGLFQEKVKRLSKSCRVLERFGVGYATFLVSFPTPIEKELLDACLVKKKSKEQFSINKLDFVHGHECVDLGLSVKWATCNIGAEKPEDYGDYFAWGETKPKTTYTGENSVTLEEEFDNIARNSQNDAARANWGGTWRLPTYAELEELKSKCTWTWTTQGGHNGYKVVGPNGSSIFLPAAGCRIGTLLRNAGEFGDYWSSMPYESDTQFAYYLCFGSGGHGVEWCYRSCGDTVRPVSD